MTADQRAIREVIAQWHRATAEGDVDAVLRLVSDDVIFLVPGQDPVDRSKFEAGLRQLLKSHRIESKGEVKECRVSGELAYCWTHLTVSIASSSGGTANVRTGSALSIFGKQPDGKWLLVRDANLLPPMK